MKSADELIEAANETDMYSQAKAIREALDSFATCETEKDAMTKLNDARNEARALAKTLDALIKEVIDCERRSRTLGE